MKDQGIDTGGYHGQEIATRIPMGNGFAAEQPRSSGSRYADKQADSSGRRASSPRKKTSGSRKGGRGPFILLCVILAVLVICAVTAILWNTGLFENLRREGAGTSGELRQESMENAGAQDGSDTQGAEGDDGAAQSAPEDGQDAPAPEDGADASENAPETPGDQGGSDNLVDLSILDSPYAVLMKADSGEILASKRGDEKIFPASMTKMLTVLTAIEQIPDLDAKVYMAEDFYEDLYDQDASRAGYEPGEEAVIRELLYGAMLPSGAECCMELALQAAGSESAFVDLMNQKVAELGLEQTHFTNCTGLHDENQFSTCTEIAKILRAGLQNETFYDVITTHHYSVAPTNIHPEGFTFWSTLFKSTKDEIVTGGEIICGKTGFTEEAGHCLASAAEIYGEIYILVTAGWAEDTENEMYHIDDAFRAYDALGAALA